MSDSTLVIHPLTPERFSDFEQLFGPRGACGGCWCMFWKIPGREYHQKTGDVTYAMQKTLVEQGLVPGLIAYADGIPCGWIAVEPRSAYPRLARSRVLKPVDTAEVWSVPCFFTARSHRRQGITVALLKAAIEYVAAQGGKIVEGYPVQPKGQQAPDAFVFTGLPAAFLKAGFQEVARFSPTRPIFRYSI